MGLVESSEPAPTTTSSTTAPAPTTTSSTTAPAPEKVYDDYHMAKMAVVGVILFILIIVLIVLLVSKSIALNKCDVALGDTQKNLNEALNPKMEKSA